jgi:uncharacterized repeat protein (TIGR01451 family)
VSARALSARTPPLLPLLPLLLACLLLVAWLPARADAPVALYQSFRGTVNFTGTLETMRSRDNKQPCKLVNGNKGIAATLSGIPKGATVLSAQLYWAGSGAQGDYTVNFDGESKTADVKRQYLSKTIGGGSTYFGGAVDVTSQVRQKGNASYSFSGLSIDTGDPWCSVQGVVGGFALVVIYSHPDEPFRMLNLYEGFQYFRDNSLKIELSGFNVPKPLPEAATGRVGHVTWEGDATLSQGGEDLLFNGIPLTDTMNKSGNQFNSASNITGDATTYGIDFDVYTVKSPVIQAGDTTAITTYRSGQDLVLLGAEIVAMPYAAIADLALSMTRTGELRVGTTSSYTLTVVNNGIDAETGPVTVVDTLPSGLKLVSASGTGWSCTSAAQTDGTTRVTCTQNGPVASGAKMTPLTIAVTPGAGGDYTNTATVSGKTGDNNSANNTATNKGSATNPTAAALVFTTEACSAGQEIVTSPSDPGCHQFIGPVVAGDSNTRIFITRVDKANKASALDTRDSTLALDLMASCLPNSGVSATYAAQVLDCKGTWTTVNVTVPANKPSATLANGSAFFYADVGRVSLSMRSDSTVTAVDFISRPADIRFQSVWRPDGYPDLRGTFDQPVPWSKSDDIAFARAGEVIALRLGAWMANGGWAPSFGKEPAALAGVLDADNLGLDFRFDTFLPNLGVAPAVPIADKDLAVRGAFVIEQGFATNPAIAGAFEGKVRWYEAGYLALTPWLVDYLGTGQAGGAKADVDPASKDRLVPGTRVIGRFYPDHFVTELTASFDCVEGMNCPALPASSVEGATYSLEPFTVQVTAYGVSRDGQPARLSLFQQASGRPIALGAYKAPNDGALPAGGSFAILPGSGIPNAAGPADFPALKAQAIYKLGLPFSPDARRAQDWGAPTAIYLRAGMNEAIQADGNVRKAVQVSSLVPAGAGAGTRYEDGLMVVAGRLLVQNVSGSELLRMPVGLSAQFWNGNAWLTSASDSFSTVGATITLGKCTRSFALSTAGQCKPGAVAPASPGTPVQLEKGMGRLTLQAPGRGNAGSVEFTVGGGDAAAWLPSTRARATFGQYRSPVIYLREVY